MTELHDRAVAALSPLPATPRLTSLAIEALRIAEGGREKARAIGAEPFAREIASRVAADATPRVCLSATIENERLRARRIRVSPAVPPPVSVLGESARSVSVLDVAELVVVEVLTAVVRSQVE